MATTRFQRMSTAFMTLALVTIFSMTANAAVKKHKAGTLAKAGVIQTNLRFVQKGKPMGHRVSIWFNNDNTLTLSPGGRTGEVDIPIESIEDHRDSGGSMIVTLAADYGRLEITSVDELGQSSIFFQSDYFAKDKFELIPEVDFFVRK